MKKIKIKIITLKYIPPIKIIINVGFINILLYFVKLLIINKISLNTLLGKKTQYK